MSHLKWLFNFYKEMLRGNQKYTVWSSEKSQGVKSVFRIHVKTWDLLRSPKETGYG